MNALGVSVFYTARTFLFVFGDNTCHYLSQSRRKSSRYWFVNAFVHQNVSDFIHKIKKKYAFTDLFDNYLTTTQTALASWQFGKCHLEKPLLYAGNSVR